jgi:hypothetical protein
MKKYISPKIEVEDLGMENMLAESIPVGIYTSEIEDEGEILSKSIVADKNVWDTDW